MPWKTLGLWSQIHATTDEEISAKPGVFQRFAYLVWEQEVPGSNPGAPMIDESGRSGSGRARTAVAVGEQADQRLDDGH
jgi:hypothetical protein